MSKLFLTLSVNKIMYRTFNIWLNVLLFALRQRRDGLFRQIVTPGNLLIFHSRSGEPSFVALVKFLEGCD